MENVKKTLALPLSLVKAVDAAKADGVIDVKDVVHLIDPLLKLKDAVESAKAAKEALKTLTAEQRAEVYEYVKAEFDLPDDALEEKIEKGLDLVLHVVEYATLFKKA